MKIRNNWTFTDRVTGLTFKVKDGKFLNKITIKSKAHKIYPRELYFTKDGKFDGTGSYVGNSGRS